MGALHEGHASLISRSIADNALTVVSIFVNPTQFNDARDLATYPRDLDADCRLIASLGGRVAVFAPAVEEIYPEPDTRTFSYPPTDCVMEGARRPGHFNGVCQVVSRLFSIVSPTRAYFGEKDFQQIAVIRAMMADHGFTFELVPCPIVREASGLALSSRNALLSEAERAVAVHISRVLGESVARQATSSVEEVSAWVVETLNAIEGLEVEYYAIVDGKTLRALTAWDESDDPVGCITVYCGHRPVRLIDNVHYTPCR